MGEMRATDRPSAAAAISQMFTEELIARAGIAPGMRIAVMGAGTGELAFLVAERVGDGGAVVAIDDDPGLLALARQRAREQRFDRVTFQVDGLGDVEAEPPFDGAVGRFFLMRRSDPVAAIRRAAAFVRPGGRVAFAEWHFESILWEHVSAWPAQPLYRRSAELTIEGLRRNGQHVDMGLRLVNAFVEAGLPLPAMRTDLRACGGATAASFEFYAETLRDLLPALERSGIATSRELEIETLALRMRQEALAAGGHAFLPLLVGAWTRTAAEDC